MKKTKLFFYYLQYRAKGLCVFFGAALLFFAIFLLYSLPLEAYYYALALCAAAGLPVLLWDAFHFFKRHRQLETLTDLIKNDFDLLPEPQTLPEKDDQLLMRSLFDEAAKARTEERFALTELSDSYTLWEIGRAHV